ncbi:MAG: hypothetical protein H6586_02230 [Flavobacteriales bacterium]|nr:hypothetical protein [Flavobacteriales bacterium]
MKNILIKLIVLLTVIGCNSVPSGCVRIDFTNKSNENIKSISFTDLIDNIENIENIEVGETKTLTFKHSGEGTYQFIVEFESGKQLVEKERYVEQGYFITENIFDTIVKTDY